MDASVGADGATQTSQSVVSTSDIQHASQLAVLPPTSANSTVDESQSSPQNSPSTKNTPVKSDSFVDNFDSFDGLRVKSIASKVPAAAAREEGRSFAKKSPRRGASRLPDKVVGGDEGAADAREEPSRPDESYSEEQGATPIDCSIVPVSAFDEVAEDLDCTSASADTDGALAVSSSKASAKKTKKKKSKKLVAAALVEELGIVAPGEEEIPLALSVKTEAPSPEPVAELDAAADVRESEQSQGEADTTVYFEAVDMGPSGFDSTPERQGRAEHADQSAAAGGGMAVSASVTPIPLVGENSREASFFDAEDEEDETRATAQSSADPSPASIIVDFLVEAAAVAYQSPDSLDEEQPVPVESYEEPLADTTMQQSKELLEVERKSALALDALRQSLSSKDEELSELSSRLATEQRSSEQARAAIEALDAKNKEHERNIKRLCEVVAERERALEVSTSKMAESNSQTEHLTRKVSDLQTEIKAKDTKLTLLQSLSSSESALKRQIEKLLEESSEKDERLAAFVSEGKALSLKQAEMEKSYRKMAKDMREKDAEIAKLQESKGELAKTVEQLAADLKKFEVESSSASKSLSAMQAVSSVSNDRLRTLETELGIKLDELVSQKRALDASWAENGELKRQLTEAKLELDEVRMVASEGVGRLQGLDEVKRQYEQREAVLRSTAKQMQDTLQRQMEEATSREERLRGEASEMRRRWQDAVASREALTSEMSDATAPLLRQVAASQESMRVKSDQWRALESSLNERAIRAEASVEKAEHRRQLLEEQLETFKDTVSSMKSAMANLQLSSRKSEELCQSLSLKEKLLAETVKDLETRLGVESTSRQSLLVQLRDLELKHSLDLQEAREALSSSERQHESHCAQIRKEMQLAKEQQSYLPKAPPPTTADRHRPEDKSRSEEDSKYGTLSGGAPL